MQALTLVHEPGDGLRRYTLDLQHHQAVLADDGGPALQVFHQTLHHRGGWNTVGLAVNIHTTLGNSGARLGGNAIQRWCVGSVVIQKGTYVEDGLGVSDALCSEVLNHPHGITDIALYDDMVITV